jgi:2-polyprenyl-3-methyl-5-hydroxy-6-metoxy-1,4-benzoquinol methylase
MKTVEAQRSLLELGITEWPEESATFDYLWKNRKTQERDRRFGELFAELARQYGQLAAKFLFRSQWNYQEPEWFDHRLHLLDPENQWNDFWTMSAANVIRVLPFGGRLLDLCAGDGFYDYWFYSQRATVVCVEKDLEAYQSAVTHHSKPEITYHHADVLQYEPESEAFDVVLIRGAVEHFKEDEQSILIAKSWNALKRGGYFCGDTIASTETGKAHPMHEKEWRDARQMRDELSKILKPMGCLEKDVETWALQSKARTTLFWRCKK